MTDIEYVRSIHPGAVCVPPATPGLSGVWKIYDGSPANVALSWSHPTKAEAWADAAKWLKERQA